MSHAVQMLPPHGVRTLHREITEVASVGLGDTGKAIILTAFLLCFQFGFGFSCFFFLIPLLKLSVSFLTLAFVLTEVAVDPALDGIGELGDFVATLIHRVRPHFCPVCLDPFQNFLGRVCVAVILVVEGRRG
jgi:hypothetical protein